MEKQVAAMAARSELAFQAAIDEVVGRLGTVNVLVF